MLIALLACFLFALSMVLLGKWVKTVLWWLPMLLPTALFVYFLSLGSASQTVSFDWLPQLGVRLSLQLDGLSRLFVLLITGIGTLVFAYTAAYLKGHAYLDRFYGYLSLFMGAMIGLVLSENLISLFVFWELTSISSFFLIGFNNDQAASRKSALTALIITGMGGLSLLAAGILLGYMGDTYSIIELTQSADYLRDHPHYGLAVLLIFGAAFTKSAQFPFHFWLPGAMKAPTPVSTYLHSATMVKAGVYLLLRFTPILGGTDLWQTSLLWVGGITMLYAAFHSIFRTDMKAILAYSTIAALGVLVFLIGMGSSSALQAAGVFILVHALYKATLFLITGIVDHETHSRDILQLSGLRKVLLPVAVAGLLAAVSNAGIPPSFGFIGKDLMYEAALHHGAGAWWLLGALVLTNVLLLYAGFLVGIKPFIGRLPEKHADLHWPSPWMWVPPVLLAVLSIGFGLWPVPASHLSEVFLPALGFEPPAALKLWHGFNLILGLSAATIGSGLLLWFLLKPGEKGLSRLQKLTWLSPENLLTGFAKGVGVFSVVWTNLFQHGYLRYYVMTIVLVLSAGMGYRMFNNYTWQTSFTPLLDLTVYEVSIVAIMLVSIGFAVFSKSRLAAVAGLGVVGYAICLLFVFYSAPDLAMTQFTVDTLTVILFVLVLYRLPKYMQISNKLTIARDGVVALTFGGLVTLLALLVLEQPVQRDVADFYAANAYLLAKGKNVVNVILVDFRGLDTLVEITVLSIAALGVFGLLKLRLKTSERRG